MPDSQDKRRWFQFSLRTMLFSVTLFATLLCLTLASTDGNHFAQGVLFMVLHPATILMGIGVGVAMARRNNTARHP